MKIGLAKGKSAFFICAAGLMFTLLLFSGSGLMAQVGEGHRQDEGRNYDARITYNQGFVASPQKNQQDALKYSLEQLSHLTARFSETTGVTRVMFNRGDYLTPANPGVEPIDLAVGFVSSNATALGLQAGDVYEYLITNQTYTKVTGSQRVFMQQMIDGIPVYNGQIQVNINREGRIISVNNDYMPQLAEARNTAGPSIDAEVALRSAMNHIGIQYDGRLKGSTPEGAQQETRFQLDQVSQEPITARLVYLPIRSGEARLVWNLQIYTLDSQHWYDINIDAQNSQIWTRFDWVVSESYTVYPQPVESPNHTTPLPPADGRQTVGIPNPSSSPSGWHDDGTSTYTITRGNNVNAYEDGNNSNSPGLQPDCGATLDCNFAIDLTADPDTYEAAAVTNLFFWNNLMHDITYEYGFDEPNGNFQENNFGLGGNGGDSVNAEAQDGGGTNNANFATPSDGSNPRMQMYLWTQTSPRRDGDFDNGIIAHEYGHGISNRLVGGPTNVSCLNNSQQPGEGWSDYFSLAYTIEAGDVGTTGRGVGTYALGQPVTGAGIRTQQYSTDGSINTHTYESINGMAVPHGVGEVWAEVIWRCTWRMIDDHGFSANIYDPFGGAGNQRMILYVVEGMKNTSCSPTFVDCRDGIIQAATDNYGGEDVCALWEVFGAYGIGTDAVSGGSNSTSPTNGFDIPLECQCDPAPIADAGPDQTICQGDSATIGTPAQPNNTYSWSPGGATTAQITVSPATTTTYTVTATTSCGSLTDSVTVVVDDGSSPGLNDDLEGDTSGWATTGLWHLTNNSACIGSSSPTHAFYYGDDGSCTYNTGSATSGSLTSPSISGITASSTLNFDYYRVVESFSGNYDITQVDVLVGGSPTTVWSLNSSNASTAAWLNSGNISLAAYASQIIQLRFSFDSVDSVSNGFTGWGVDNIVVTGTSNCTPGNTAPTVTITAPPTGTSVVSGTSINFTGTANDAEDGDISASISWSSNLDGGLGSGASINATLSVGTHTITASATDSGSLTGTDSIMVTVTSPNTAPVVTITAPADGTSVPDGTAITFTGTANDAEDGDISGSISWSSSIDGGLGSGASVNATLSVGTHTITASATDSGSLSGSDSITVTVTPVANTAPVVTITAPADGTSVTDGTAITFTGTANDAEDGDISGSISWSSSIDGGLGSGASVNATLSVGTHTITATATDSGSLSGSDSITVTVTSTSWTQLDFSDFESGWQGWQDGGSDCRRSANDASFAHQGTYCVRLRDNSGVASSMTSPVHDLSSYGEARVEFWWYPWSFEGSEDIFVELWDGSSWVVIANFVHNVDFTNNVFSFESIIVDGGTVNLDASARVRIRCDASGNGDRAYIDEVDISAR
jgi:extracellular elastinolytic metalloproteinase